MNLIRAQQPCTCDVFIPFSSLKTELVIPATGNVFYAMTSSSVDFLLRRKGGNSPFGSHPISTETSATFPRIKAKGRRLVRNLFWHQIFVCEVEFSDGLPMWMQSELSRTVNVAFSVQHKTYTCLSPVLLPSSPKHQEEVCLCFSQHLLTGRCGRYFRTPAAVFNRAICTFPSTLIYRTWTSSESL